MSTPPAPEPPPLYHGTRRPFGRGGLLVPGDHVGADHHGLGRSGWVYLTPDLELAKEYARVSRGRGRAKVVEVRPWGEVYIDDSTIAGGEEQESYRCEAATVLRRVWIEPVRSAPPPRPEAPCRSEGRRPAHA